MKIKTITLRRRKRQPIEAEYTESTKTDRAETEQPIRSTAELHDSGYSFGDVVDGNKEGLYDGFVTAITGYGDQTRAVRMAVSAEGDGSDTFYSLNDIKDKIGYVPGEVVTVIIESDVFGTVYSFGNEGDYWVCVGKTMGYA